MPTVGGFVVHTVPTGQGNVVGILPVSKIIANLRAVRLMGDHIDLDVSAILRRGMTIDEAGDKLIESIIPHRKRLHYLNSS